MGGALPRLGLKARALCVKIGSVDSEDERELQAWATRLTTSTDPERKAMGKALLMLLRQIESLRSELERLPDMPPTPGNRAQPVDVQATGELALEDIPAFPSGNSGLRFRLRNAAYRRRRS
jgi:hypothetical protein